MSSDRATIRDDEPIPGMPAQHPQLGKAVLAHRPHPISRARRWLGVLGLAFPVVGRYFAVASGAELWQMLGILAGLAWVAILRPWRASGGGAFVVYEKGIADSTRMLRWSALHELHLDAEFSTLGGVPVGGHRSDCRVIGPSGSFRVAGAGPEIEQVWGWVIEHGLIEPARRDLAKARGGGTVSYRFASLERDGLRWGHGGMGWSDYARHEMEKGTLRIYSREKEVLRVPSHTTNAMLFRAVLREVDRERLSDGGSATAR